MPDALNDEMRIAWARVNWVLDTYGDGPEYREAWNEWADAAHR